MYKNHEVVLGDILYYTSVLHIQGSDVLHGCKIASYGLMVNVLESKVDDYIF
jgi:hypothetical protein